MHGSSPSFHSKDVHISCTTRTCIFIIYCTCDVYKISLLTEFLQCSDWLRFQMRWWLVGDDIRKANDTVVGKVTNGVIYGIQKNNVYQLRVLGISKGGDGKMSPTKYFTLGENWREIMNLNRRKLKSKLYQYLVYQQHILWMASFSWIERKWHIRGHSIFLHNSYRKSLIRRY